MQIALMLRVTPKPSFDQESLYWQQGYQHIAGVDEVGRGAFAGPVVAAAVILPKVFPRIDEINDSKVLSPRKREELSLIIKEYALSYAISEISVPFINKVGIGKASQMAFRKAIKQLHLQPDFIFVDAFYIQHLTKKKQKPIIHGDSISLSIAAASIIAKVYRDQLMTDLALKYTNYQFDIHKGYGTKRHQEALKVFGLSKIHRTSFNLDKFI